MVYKIQILRQMRSSEVTAKRIVLLEVFQMCMGRVLWVRPSPLRPLRLGEGRKAQSSSTRGLQRDCQS